MLGDLKNWKLSRVRDRRPGGSVHRRLAQVGVLLLIAIGLVALPAGSASAHTPSVEATCSTLSVDLSSYNDSKANFVVVMVDDSVKASTAFGSSYHRDFDLGDQTVPHDWVVSVKAWDDRDGSKGWTRTETGTSRPCAPPDACPKLPGNQPPGTDCTQPRDDHEIRKVHNEPDCTSHTVTITKQQRTRSYTWDGKSWQPGPWSDWQTISTWTVPTTPQDCPATEVTATAPTYRPPSCDTAPALDYSNGTGYHWVASGPGDARVLTAVADAGYVLVGQTTYGPYDLTGWTLQDRIEHGCVAPLGNPVVKPSEKCGVNGSIVALVGDRVTYAISGGSWSDLPAGDYVITATLAGGATEFGYAEENGWHVVGNTATKTVHVDQPKTCVTPSVVVSAQACIPEQPGGVTAGWITLGDEAGLSYVVRDGTGAVVNASSLSSLAAGTYTVTATALDGYELVDGNDFVHGQRVVTIAPPGTDCSVTMPVQPKVSSVDECYTADDAVEFEADNAYWTAEITDDSHVTFTAKAGYFFDGAEGAPVKQLVLEYPPLTDEQCPLVPGDVEATCVGSVPYLAYDLALPQGFETDDERPLTITFVNPAGADYVVSGLPLSGRLLWPGASATEPLMWPGWDLVNGEYVSVGDDNFGWTRHGITVSFDVNPHYATTLTYPPASVACANPPGSERPEEPTTPSAPPALFRPPPAQPPANPELPNTGGPSSLLTGIAGLLLLGGCVLVGRARRSS